MNLILFKNNKIPKFSKYFLNNVKKYLKCIVNSQIIREIPKNGKPFTTNFIQ